jgi:hypothetical protein
MFIMFSSSRQNLPLTYQAVFHPPTKFTIKTVERGFPSGPKNRIISVPQNDATTEKNTNTIATLHGCRVAIGGS